MVGRKVKQDTIRAYTWASSYYAYQYVTGFFVSDKCECSNIVSYSGLVEMVEKGDVEP